MTGRIRGGGNRAARNCRLGFIGGRSTAIDGGESMRHLHGQSLRTAEKQPIEGYSREFADDPQRHFLAERSTALDIVPPTALDTEKLGKLLLAPAPIEAHCLSQAARTF
jgi:hypothetical protein